MKLKKLKSIANNSLRSELWTPQPIGEDPFHWMKPTHEITVDLIKGELSPSMGGDSVERYYKGISEWFHVALQKEGIPLEVIDRAVLLIAPHGKACIIEAQGRIFRSNPPKHKISKLYK